MSNQHPPRQPATTTDLAARISSLERKYERQRAQTEALARAYTDLHTQALDLEGANAAYVRALNAERAAHARTQGALTTSRAITIMQARALVAAEAETTTWIARCTDLLAQPPVRILGRAPAPPVLHPELYGQMIAAIEGTDERHGHE